MNFKQIGILLIMALFLFGCSGENSEKSDDDEVTITFNMDGGTPDFGKVKINKGSSLGNKYMSPKKTDFAFAGWYEINDTAYKTSYTATTPINNDITLKARWRDAPTEGVDLDTFSLGANTKIDKVTGSFNGYTDVIKISATSKDYAWNVISLLLSGYYGKLITVTLDMQVWVSNDAIILWQINNNAANADAWGGSWKIIAGDEEPLSKEAWFHLHGSVTGTPQTGDNAGNQVYISGGGSGGRLKDNPVDIYIADFSMAISDNSPIIQNNDLLTIGGTKDLKPRLNANMTGTVSWSSSDPSKVSVDTNGIVTSSITSFSGAEGTQKYTAGPAKASVTITATANGNTQTFTIIATTEAQEYISELPPLKSHFPSTFLVGNIATSNDAGSVINNAKLTRHFNALTSENDMKPSALSDNTDPNTYKWNNADRFVTASAASGFKVIGHTLLWHQQIPTWQVNMKDATKEIALTAMKKYITDVVTHFKGKIYSWDVLNEAFPDGVSAFADWKTAMRPENPWFKAIGSDFVYEAFLAARLVDPDAKLYYNDFNTDSVGKATMIRNMVRDVNQKYKSNYPSETKLLIEGIGMQEHHNTDVTAESIRAALTMFKELGVKIAVSEIDVLAQSWGSFSSVGQGANKHTQSTVTNNQLLTQADLYKQYMTVYKEFSDTIVRITFWGISDNSSWRSAGLPLLFDKDGKAKPAYYKFVGATPTP